MSCDDMFKACGSKGADTQQARDNSRYTAAGLRAADILLAEVAVTTRRQQAEAAQINATAERARGLYDALPSTAPKVLPIDLAALNAGALAAYVEANRQPDRQGPGPGGEVQKG
jgi:hypothetical protein